MQSQTMSNLDSDTIDEIQTWADVFRELDQWNVVETFAEHHAQALDTRAGFRRFCSPKIGHLLAHDCKGFQILHHVHQDGADDINIDNNDNDDDEGNIWRAVQSGFPIHRLRTGNCGRHWWTPPQREFR